VGKTIMIKSYFFKTTVSGLLFLIPSLEDEKDLDFIIQNLENEIYTSFY